MESFLVAEMGFEPHDYRTVRIAAELRLRKSAARSTPCSAVSHGAKTILNRFCLLAGYSPSGRFATSDHNLEGHGAQSHPATKKKAHLLVSLWLRRWDLNLMTAAPFA